MSSVRFGRSVFVFERQLMVGHSSFKKLPVTTVIHHLKSSMSMTSKITFGSSFHSPPLELNNKNKIDDGSWIN